MQLPLLDQPLRGRLTDRRQRAVGYLRLSVTDACSMRCLYCRPAFHRAAPGGEALTPRLIESLVRHLVATRGVYKVRLTGGDPTCRPDLIEIVERLAGIAGLTDLAMSTNGLTLARQAAALRRAGLHRVNVSLDTVDPARFAQLTGVDRLDRVLAGIDAAADAGLAPVKLNCVVVRGHNDDQLGGLLDHAADRGLPLRFIELMPMGPIGGMWDGRYVSAGEVRERLAPRVRSWGAIDAGGADRAGVADVGAPAGRGPAAARMTRAVLRDGRVVDVGFITPMSDHFCDTCNRLRVTASGEVYPCLMDAARGNLMSPLRAGDLDAVDTVLDAAFDDKADVHPPVAPGVMTRIGG